MGEVIQGKFPSYHKMTLVEARKFLGQNWFKKGLIDASIAELIGAVNNPEALISGAARAYEAILEYRLKGITLPDDRPVAPVIDLTQKRVLKKAA